MRGVLENGPAATRSFSAAREQCIWLRASITRSPISPPMCRAPFRSWCPADILDGVDLPHAAGGDAGGRLSKKRSRKG